MCWGPSVCGGQVCVGAKCVCGPSMCVGQVCEWAKCVCGPSVCVGQVCVWAKYVCGPSMCVGQLRSESVKIWSSLTFSNDLVQFSKLS